MNRISLVLLSMAAIVGAFVLVTFPKWTVDDAYISYRYGVNLAESGQLTWNPKESPVEGYTGIVLPLVAAAAHKIKIDIGLTIKSLMMMSWAGVMILLWIIGKNLKINSKVASASILLWILNPILYTHLFSGLETLMFSLFLLWCVHLMILVIKQQRFFFDKIIALPILCFALTLIRPEGMMLAPVIMLAGLIARKVIWRKREIRYVVNCLIFYVLPLFTYIFWRTQYYGDWLPNTWYAKRYEGIFNPEAILEMGHTILVTVGPMLIWLMLGRILFKSRRPSDIQEYVSVFTSFTVLSLPLLMALGYGRSNLFMNYSHRFFAPILSIFMVPIMIEGNRLFHLLKGGDIKKKTAKVLKYLMIPLSMLQLSLFVFKLKTEITWTQYYQRIMEQEWIPVADELKAHLAAGAKVAIYMDAGMIAYRSGLDCIDFGKLNDRALAHGPRDSAFVTDYFFEQDPDAAVFTSFEYDNYNYIPEAHHIQEDPRFENYRLFRKFKTEMNDPYFQFIYLKKTP